MTVNLLTFRSFEVDNTILMIFVEKTLTKVDQELTFIFIDQNIILITSTNK